MQRNAIWLGSAMSNGRDNNLNLLRALAATAVIWAHAWAPSGYEPFSAYFKVGTGDLGVDIFFFLSGLLVAKSFHTRGVVEFALARAKRIYPALWVSTLVLLAVAGFAFSPLSAGEFWKLVSTWDYAINNALVLPGIGAQLDLPFAFNETQTTFNVPLWTLPHELSMYGLLAVVGVLGGLRRAWVPLGIMMFGLIGASAETFFGMDLFGESRSRFLAFFFCGAFCYAARDRIPLNGWVALTCVIVVGALPMLIEAPEFARIALMLVLPYVTLWLAFVPKKWVRSYNKLGDYSYGLYIYSFPVQLAIQIEAGITDPLANFVLAMMISLTLAAISWHVIEKRALKLRMPLPSWVKSPKSA